MTPPKYHKVYLIFTDVYEHAGKLTFQKMTHDSDTNLVLIPLEFINRLAEDAEKKGDRLAKVTLEYFGNARKFQEVYSDSIIKIRKVNSGLHLAFVDKIPNTDEFSISTLVETLTKKLHLKIPPTLLTTRQKHLAKYGSMRSLTIETPEFLSLDERVIYDSLRDGNDDLYQALGRGEVSLDEAHNLMGGDSLVLNQCIRFRRRGGYEYGRVKATLDRDRNYAVVGAKDERVELIGKLQNTLSVGNHHFEYILGVSPMNDEQYLAASLLLNHKDISLVILTGGQSSGKTTLAYCVGVDSILDYSQDIRKLRDLQQSRFFHHMVIMRPGFPELTHEEQVQTYFSPYESIHKQTALGRIFPFDEMRKHPLYESKYGLRSKDINAKIMDTLKQKKLYIGGLPEDSEAIEPYSLVVYDRTFQNNFLFIDGGQNLTPSKIMEIVEREGVNTKIVVTGDPGQVVNPDCTREINGLSYLLKQSLGKPYAARMHLTTRRISPAALDASQWRG